MLWAKIGVGLPPCERREKELSLAVGWFFLELMFKVELMTWFHPKRQVGPWVPRPRKAQCVLKDDGLDKHHSYPGNCGMLLLWCCKLYLIVAYLLRLCHSCYLVSLSYEWSSAPFGVVYCRGGFVLWFTILWAKFFRPFFHCESEQ